MEKDWKNYTATSWEALGEQTINGLLRGLPVLTPHPTGLRPTHEPLSGARAVLFDVYGTLLISASGDIEITRFVHDGLVKCLEEAGVGISQEVDRRHLAASMVETFKQTIRDHHARSRQGGNTHPEVDIAEVWEQTVDAVVRQTSGVRVEDGFESRLLALSYELLANPVYPMPGMADCMRRLRDRGFLLGLISNAQFFTPLILEFFLSGEQDLAFPFEPQLLFFSYQHGSAKPDAGMFRNAAAKLRELGIDPVNTVYVGNDMRNDIWTARQAGFRTVLFAGDRRSLRLRQDREGMAGVRPDAVVTGLMQIPQLLSDVGPTP